MLLCLALALALALVLLSYCSLLVLQPSGIASTSGFTLTSTEAVRQGQEVGTRVDASQQMSTKSLIV
jgi:hypothetical protein